MIIRGGRRELFGCTGDEIGDYRIQGHPFAGDQHAGLTRGAKVCRYARACSARVSASAVYFLPRAQSVPTVSTR